MGEIKLNTQLAFTATVDCRRFDSGRRLKQQGTRPIRFWCDIFGSLLTWRTRFHMTRMQIDRTVSFIRSRS